MSDGINLVILQGNLGADPELKQTAGGPMLKMSLATTHTYFDKEEKLQSNTEWHRVKLFGKRAEGLARILQKGSPVSILGRNHTSSYEKNGEKRYSTDVIAHEVTLVSGGYRQRTEANDVMAAVGSTSFAPLARARPPLPEAPAASLVDLPF